MAERFNINDERSFYLAGIRDLSKEVESIDCLRFLYKVTRDMWLNEAKETSQIERGSGCIKRTGLCADSILYRRIRVRRFRRVLR